MTKYLLYILYPLILLALYPVVEFEIYKYTHAHESVSSFSYWFRILFSGPLLIAVGILLVWFYKGIHKLVGIVSVAIGVYWLVMLSRDIIAEIRIF